MRWLRETATRVEMNGVDVIIPVKNRSELLTTRALASLHVQDHSDVEITLVDDGSTQEELAAIEAVMNQMRSEGWRISLLSNQRKPGACGARNTGYLATSKPFVVWLDSDDKFLPNKLTTDLALILSEDSDFSISRAQHVVEGETIPKFWGNPIAPTHGKHAFHLPFQTMCALFRRSFLEAKNLMWNEDLISHQDWEFSNRCLLQSDRWSSSQIVTAHYYVPQTHGESIGSQLTQEKIESQHRAMAIVRQFMANNGFKYSWWDELRILRHKWFLNTRSKRLQRERSSSS